MRRPGLAWALVLALGATSTSPAWAEPKGTPAARRDVAREDVKRAMKQGYTFCSAPRRPLGFRQADLCSLADEVDGCEGFARSCEAAAQKEKPRSRTLDGILAALGPVAQVLVWLLVFVIAALVLVPIIRAIMKATRDKRVADTVDEKPNRAVAVAPPPPDPADITDAEAALREADALARAGNLDRALGMYLAASLAALDRRGAIRLARHRTNGEYVRFCTETTTRGPLREIVREVDRADYGKIAPSQEGVSKVASNASSIVKAIATMMVMSLAVLGCGGAGLKGGGNDDPAGDGLALDVLRRGGYAVSPLKSSIATMPIPTTGETPVLLLDIERVPLEDESAAHLMRWIEAGGVAMIFGGVMRWPKELGARPDRATTRSVTVETPVGPMTGARLATAQALTWPKAERIATVGDRMYAARITLGRGAVLGVANDDLLTNVGVARPDNAAALVALVQAAEPNASTLTLARPEDGIPPPENPFASLVRAGLAKFAWHALAACGLLFLAVGVRRARAEPQTPPARRAFAEHVEATGAFYDRARALGHALHAYGRFVELRLRERVPRGVDPATFLASRSGVELAHAKKIYERALAAKPTDEPRGDEIATIRELRQLLAKALEAG